MNAEEANYCRYCCVDLRGWMADPFLGEDGVGFGILWGRGNLNLLPAASEILLECHKPFRGTDAIGGESQSENRDFPGPGQVQLFWRCADLRAPGSGDGERKRGLAGDCRGYARFSHAGEDIATCQAHADHANSGIVILPAYETTECCQPFCDGATFAAGKKTKLTTDADA